MAEAILKEGCGSTASRLLRGERRSLSAWSVVLRSFKEMESSLYFGSGYAANLGVLSTFLDRHDLVFSDAQNHASIVDGIRLSRAKRVKFRHCDVDDLARHLRVASDGRPKVSRNGISLQYGRRPSHRWPTMPNFAAKPEQS
jgi:8-amino-7-oxononanoate synthase